MPRDATDTRARLLAAGEIFFAAHGVQGALVRDIVAGAGQSNDSAVSYHFGSREGLLRAILDKHVAVMEQSRHEALEAEAAAGGGSLPERVRALVEPTAERLLSPDGRAFLRIIVQLAGGSGVGAGRLAAPIEGTAVAAQLALVEQAMPDRLRPAVRRERLESAILLLTASLAERARRIDAGRHQPLGHDRYQENLVAMLVALLEAPSM